MREAYSRCAFPLKPGQERIAMMDFDLTLYLVTDSTGMEEEAFIAKVDAACRGGVTLLQLREKARGGREFLHLARRVKAVADRCGVPLLIDDRADIAMAVDAAGVHVGQEDLPVEAVRKLLGPGKIVGATAKTVGQARIAKEQGADYLGVGAMFPTTTKVKTVLTKVETLADIVREVRLPVVAIGGLNAANCDILRGSGFSGMAVVSAIMKADDPEAAARSLKEKVLSLRRQAPSAGGL